MGSTQVVHVSSPSFWFNPDDGTVDYMARQSPDSILVVHPEHYAVPSHGLDEAISTVLQGNRFQQRSVLFVLEKDGVFALHLVPFPAADTGAEPQKSWLEKLKDQLREEILDEFTRRRLPR